MRVRHRVILLLLAGTSLVPASGAFGQQPTPPSGETGLGIRLTEAPESRRDDPRALVYVVDHVATGSELTRRIEVRNDSGTAIEPSVYVAPATLEEGQFVPGGQGDDGEIPSWSTVSPSALSLPPGGAETVTLTIAVPDDAPDGEFYGAVFAEINTPQGDVTQVSRVGVRVYLSVGEGAEPESDFEVSTLTADRTDDERPVIRASVTNTGGRALDMSGELLLEDGPAGLRAGPVPAELGTTLGIDATHDVEIRLDPGTPLGPWRAVLTLRSGTIERTVEADITFPRPGERARTFDATEQTRKGIAAAVAGVAAATVAVGGGAYALRHRHALRSRARGGG